jgi:hypothetical protein
LRESAVLALALFTFLFRTYTTHWQLESLPRWQRPHSAAPRSTRSSLWQFAGVLPERLPQAAQQWMERKVTELLSQWLSPRGKQAKVSVRIAPTDADHEARASFYAEVRRCGHAEICDRTRRKRAAGRQCSAWGRRIGRTYTAR